jgi:hypothetical protein
MAEYSLPLWRVLVLRNKPCLGTWLQVCRAAYLTIVLEAVCSRVCGGICRIVSFTHAILYTCQ